MNDSMATEQSSDEYDDDLPVPRHLHSTNFHDRHHPVSIVASKFNLIVELFLYFIESQLQNQKRRNVRPDTDKARTQQKRVTSLQKKVCCTCLVIINEVNNLLLFQVETMAKQNGGQFVVLCALPNQQRWSGKTIVCGSYAHNFMGSALGQDLVKAWEAQFDELQGGVPCIHFPKSFIQSASSGTPPRLNSWTGERLMMCWWGASQSCWPIGPKTCLSFWFLIS